MVIAASHKQSRWLLLGKPQTADPFVQVIEECLFKLRVFRLETLNVQAVRCLVGLAEPEEAFLAYFVIFCVWPSQN